MKKTFIFFSVCFLILVFLRSSFAYDANKAIEYADRWCNDKNLDCYAWWSHDCANFVSQCLIAGGIDLSANANSKGSAIKNCSILHKNLIDTQKVQCEKRFAGEPTWLQPGDVAIFGNIEKNILRHAVFVVGKDGNSQSIFAAHTTNHCKSEKQKIVSLYGTNDGSYIWNFCCFYKISQFEWDFDQKGNFENWKISNNGIDSSDPRFDKSNIAVQSEDGWYGTGPVYLIIDPESDPQLISPDISFNASTFNAVMFRIKNKCLRDTPNNRGGNVFYRSCYGNKIYEFYENPQTDFTVINDGDFHDYLVFLGNSSGWQGTITNLRIDPIGNGEGGDDNIIVDYIKLIYHPLPVYNSLQNGDFEKGSSGNSPDNWYPQIINDGKIINDTTLAEIKLISGGAYPNNTQYLYLWAKEKVECAQVVQTIKVEGEKAYGLSGDYVTDAPKGKAHVFIEYLFDSEHPFPSSDNGTFDKELSFSPDNWSTFSFRGTAPKGARAARIYLRLGDAEKCSIKIDNLKFGTEVGGTLSTATSGEIRIAFEEDFPADDVPILPEPIAPTLVLPENNSHYSSNVSFQWNSVSGADQYEFWVLPPDRSWCNQKTPLTNLSSYSPPAIGRYSWKVKSCVGDECSDFSSEGVFYFDGLPAPTLISPTNNSQMTDLDPTLEWSPVSGANFYELQIASDSGFNNLFKDIPNISGASWQLDCQDACRGQTYYWRVCASNSSDPIGQWSNPWSFSVQDDQPPPPNPKGTIAVTTNRPEANFTISGPATYICVDNCAGTPWAKTDAPIGTYSITFHSITGYNTPADSSETLVNGGTISFYGDYQPTSENPPSENSSDDDAISEPIGNDHFKWYRKDTGFVLMFWRDDVSSEEQIGNPYLGGNWNNWQYIISLIPSSYSLGWLETASPLNLPEGDYYFTFKYPDADTGDKKGYSRYTYFSVDNPFAVTRMENGEVKKSYGAKFTNDELAPFSAGNTDQSPSDGSSSQKDEDQAANNPPANNKDSSKNEDPDKPGTKPYGCFIQSLNLKL